MGSGKGGSVRKEGLNARVRIPLPVLSGAILSVLLTLSLGENEPNRMLNNSSSREEMSSQLYVNMGYREVVAVLETNGWLRCSPRGVYRAKIEIKCADGSTRNMCESIVTFASCQKVPDSMGVRLYFRNHQTGERLYKYCFFVSERNSEGRVLNESPVQCDSVIDFPKNCHTLDTVLYPGRRWEDETSPPMKSKQKRRMSKETFAKRIAVGNSGISLASHMVASGWSRRMDHKKRGVTDTVSCSNGSRILSDSSFVYSANGGNGWKWNLVYEIRHFKGDYRLYRYKFIEGHPDSVWNDALSIIQDLPLPDSSELCDKLDTTSYKFRRILSGNK